MYVCIVSVTAIHNVLCAQLYCMHDVVVITWNKRKPKTCCTCRIPLPCLVTCLTECYVIQLTGRLLTLTAQTECDDQYRAHIETGHMIACIASRNCVRMKVSFIQHIICTASGE